jgi:hypothetical protein
LIRVSAAMSVLLLGIFYLVAIGQPNRGPFSRIATQRKDGIR